ncbi:MAG: cytochrome c family protein [Vannielia sp.]|uniref:c-type cytochrome n=1 Tax=Rhodobacterales TaxID=204455 RepID=UPI002094630B|nr:cytochrome c family protein [Oceanicola sp. 502str15]MCO6384538.1 c-type cytochrome [Oceanicola sp. 502str15]
MFDTMTMVKAFGWLCGALLIYLLINWAGESLYAMNAGGHGEEGEEHAQGYIIEVAESTDGGTAEEDAGPAFEEVFAAADAAKGEKVFGKCKACHKLDGSNGTGPHLDGVVDRAVGSVDGYTYSSAMAEHGGTWTPEELSHFLENPKGYVSGTKMSFAGLRKIEDRANVIAYLQAQ